MTRGLSYSIGARWGLRGETPEELAERVRVLIPRLQKIDPILAHWYDAVSIRRMVPLDLAPAALARNFAKSAVRDGNPSLNYGFNLYAYNNGSGKWGPRGFSLKIYAGSDKGVNFASLSTDFGFKPDPDVITYEIVKAAALALSETFEAAYCDAFPEDLIYLWPVRGRDIEALRPAWINYVSPRFAPLVTPPSTAIVEYQPNGGLFMAAADETFITSNPGHLAVARDIFAAVAPLNADPWPDGRSRLQNGEIITRWPKR
jgi:Immunity protein 52